MPGQKVSQFTFPHHKRANGSILCSFGVPFTIFFFFRHLFYSQTFQVVPVLQLCFCSTMFRDDTFNFCPYSDSTHSTQLSHPSRIL